MYMESGAKAYQEGRYETAETMFLAARKEAEAFKEAERAEPLKDAEAVSPGDKRLASTL